MSPKALRSLNPRFVGAGGEGVTGADGKPAPERHGVGISFDCPCGCASRCFVHFTNPLDGGPSYADPGQNSWERTGDTFDNLTLTPSLQRADPGGCRWHGFITNGQAITV